MKTNEIMNIESAKRIIRHINGDIFDSHLFIEFFRMGYTLEYLDFLGQNDPIYLNNAHSQISCFLRDHQAELDIEDCGIVKSQNVNLNITDNHQWRKINN